MGGGVVAIPAPAPPHVPPPPHVLLRSEHPQVELSWSTALFSDRPKPDTLKLRKRVHAWPLEFTFKADYHTASREFSYGMMCRDQLIRVSSLIAPGGLTSSGPRQPLHLALRPS